MYVSWKKFAFCENLLSLKKKMSKSCSRCDKAVYPTEELKCLDKVINALITEKG